MNTLSLLILVGLSLTSGTESFAQSPRAGYRYSTTYREWDSGFSSYYGYSERREVCRQQYNGGWTSTTCYDVQPNDTVYVQEQICDNGYSRVSVYRSQYDNDPFVDYYVYDRRVERRYYYYNNPYYDPYWYGPAYTTVWVTLDWNNGWDKVLIGTEWALVGAQVAASSNGNSDVALIGLASMLSGSASAISGSVQIDRESKLQKYLKEQKKKSSVENLNH